MLCDSNEGGPCAKPGKMALNGKMWCATHYMRRSKKANAQKRRRLAEKVKADQTLPPPRSSASIAAAVKRNQQLHPSHPLSGVTPRSVSDLMTVLTMAAESRRDQYSFSRSSSSFQSTTQQTSTKHTNSDKSTASETTTYDRDGNITSVRRDVINETKTALEFKFKEVRKAGFKMTEIEEYTKTNAKLLSSSPKELFNTHRPLMDDYERSILSPSKLEQMKEKLELLADYLGYCDDVDEMATISSSEATMRVFRHWESVRKLLDDFEAVAFIPFYIWHAYTVGCIFMENLNFSLDLTVKVRDYIATNNFLTPSAWMNANGKDQWQKSVQSYFLRDLVTKGFILSDGWYSRGLIDAVEDRARARMRQYKADGIGYDEDEESMKAQLYKFVGNMITYYIDRRVEYECTEVKPVGITLPTMPFFITRDMTRKMQFIETKYQDVEFDFTFEVDGLYDVMENSPTGPPMKGTLTARAAAVFLPHQMKASIEKHAEELEEEGSNVKSKRAELQFKKFLDASYGN